MQHKEGALRMKLNKMIFCLIYLFFSSSFAAKKVNIPLGHGKGIVNSQFIGLPRILPKKIKLAKVKKTSQMLAQVQAGQDFVVILRKPFKSRKLAPHPADL